MSAQLGLTRNRTEKYLSYRNAARQGSGATAHESVVGAKLLEAAIDSAAPFGASAGGLPPRWVDITVEVREEINMVQAKMEELKTIYGKTLLTTFDDHHPDEVTIDVITADITRRFRKAQERLKRLNLPGAPDDVKVRSNVQRSLAMELSQLSMAFRKQQKAYLSKVKQAKEGSTSPDPFVQQGSRWKWSDDEEDQDATMSSSQIQVIDNMATVVQERDAEIAKVLQSIQDLAQIMQDLSVMVIDQGTILDRIDYNMEQVAMSIDEGVKQLQKAEKKQKNSFKVLCIMILAAAIMLMLIVVIVKNILF